MKIVYSKINTVNCEPLTVNRPGQIMIIAIVFLAVILIISAALFTSVADFLRFGSNSILREQATHLAEAGIDYTIAKLNQTAGSYSPPLTETPGGTTGSFIVTITNKTSNLKTISSTGFVPNSTSPRAKRTIKIDALIDSQQISFHYAVQVGSDGVDMANSSQITGSNGTKATVYSNGNISGSGSSQINGDAYAVGTIASPNPDVTGQKYPGASPQPLPTVDETDWLTAADANPTPCPCTISNDKTIGPQKYEGDLTISNNAFVTVNGPIHVTGNFKMTQGSTTLKLNESFGSNGTGLIVEGIVDLSQGGQFQPTSANPKGYLLVISNLNANQALQITQSGSTAIFYALNGGATMSQSAHVSALVAKQLTLSQSAILEYDQGLASAQFTSGPGAAWLVKRGTYRFTSTP